MWPELLTLTRTSCKKSVLMTCGMSIRTEACQFLWKDSRNSRNWKKNFPRDICGAGGDWQKFKRLPDKIMYGKKYGLTLVKSSESTETSMEKRGAKTRQCSKTDRNLLHWSWWSRLQRNSQKCEEKIGKTYGSDHAFQQDGSHKHHERGCKAGNCPQKIPKTIYGCTVESHESTRQRVESSVPA